MKISLTKLKDAIERIFVFLVLQLFAGAIIQVLNKAAGVAIDGVNGDPKMQILWSAIYIITLLLTVSRWKQFIHVASRNKLLLLLIGIALISFLWSAAPQVTLRRSVALVGTTLFGMYLATRYNPKELLRLIAWTFAIGAVLSVIFALALPQYGLQPYSGTLTWRGIYRHKNLLGRLMALNAVVLLLLLPTIRRNRWLVWAAIGLSVGLLLLSQTKGGLVSFVILLILLPIYKALRLNYTLMLPFLIIVLNAAGVIIMWLVNNLEPLLTSIGKDITLSSRTPLWEAVIHKIQERPLLGYGYSGFWLGWQGESAYIWQIEWNAPNAHNGILDVWVDLGLVGLIVFLLGFFVTFIRGVKWLRLTKTPEPIFVLMYLTYILITSQSESNILTQNDIFWALYVAVCFSVPRTVTVTETKISHKPSLEPNA